MISFATVCTTNYFPYLYKLIKSIKAHNKFDYPFYVFTNQLGYKERKALLNVYSKFVIVDVDTKPYIKWKKGSTKYFSFEAFRLECDKVIFIDSDMLCLGKIDKLITDYNKGLWMCKENRRPSFNAGLLVINKEYLNKQVFYKLISTDFSNKNVFGNDQKSYNILFKNEIKKLDNKFNTLVSEVDFVGLNNVVFLHYIYKPNLNRAQLKPNLKKLWENFK